MMRPRSLLAASLVLALTACKTSDDKSKLDAVAFSKGEKSYLVFFESGTFHLHQCKADEELKTQLARANDIAKAKALCTDTVTVVTQMQMKDHLLATLLGGASDDFLSSKYERMEAMVHDISELEKNVKDLKASLETGGTLSPEEKGEIKESIGALNEDLNALKKDKSTLEKNLKNPEELKKVDIAETTRALLGKVYGTADQYAEAFTKIFMSEDRIYQLKAERDVFLTSMIQNFPVACDKNMKQGERLRIEQGIESITYECQTDGTLKVLEVVCVLDGYERQNNSCVFTGKDLALSQFVATHFGICGVSAQSTLTCWGRPGAFPMMSLFSSSASENALPGRNHPVPASSPILNERIRAQKLAANSGRLCTLANDGSIYKCWPMAGDFPGRETRFTQLEGGDAHFCGINSEQKVQCWGENAYLQTEVPIALVKAKQIETTENLTCAVDTENELHCWGEIFGKNVNLDATPPADIDKAVSVTVGTRHACALLPDQSAECWGLNDVGQTGVPQGFGPFRYVKAGRYESCGVTTTGDLQCWGADMKAEIYEKGSSLKNVQRLFTSRWGSNFCALLTGGKLECWGSKIYGEETYSIKAPSDIAPVRDVAITATGYACAILESGKLRCWGNSKDIASAPQNL